MRLISEITEKKQSILIVDRKPTALSKQLKSHLKQFDPEIFVSPEIPRRIDKFDHVFLINNKSFLTQVKNYTYKNLVFIFIAEKNAARKTADFIHKNNLDNIKVVHLNTDNISDYNLERLLWFSLSRSREVFLNLQSLTPQPQSLKKKQPRLSLSKLLSKRNVFILIASVILFYYFAMLPFLGLSSLFIYKSAIALKNNDLSTVEKDIVYSETALNLASNIYHLSRPGYLLFSLALWPDSIFAINKDADSSLRQGLTLSENGSHIMQLILTKNKSEEEKNILLTRFNKMQTDMASLEGDLSNLSDELPDSIAKIKTIKSDIANTVDLLDKSKKLIPYVKDILGQNTQKQYLLLFANNMELRPGGGFIGSFGTLDVKNLSLGDVKIYDVYDADGQLTTHIDPPEPIRKYLDQPHWFLRDSAFSSDFYENYNQAKFFLNKEMGMNNFSGGIIITTTAIQNLLDAFGTVYLPDFNEMVNKDNFYIKAQVYSEKNFFPGSIQKKTFLGSLANQIFINLGSAQPEKLVSALKKSLDEKQMVMIFDDTKVQKVIDLLYWAGKTISPRCASSSSDDCVIDYVFPVDANLGVNKANFFVGRVITQRIKINSQGEINNQLIISIKNGSLSDVFPGGVYKNYFQLSLPKAARIQKITKNGLLIQDYDQSQAEVKTIGFYLEVPTQRSVEIEIDYQLAQTIANGTETYQLVFQKQTGSKNSDLNLEIYLPSNISLINQNFSPIVKDNRIFYNTSLDADKLFLFHVLKQ